MLPVIASTIHMVSTVRSFTMAAARPILSLPLETSNTFLAEWILQKQIDGVLVDDPWHDCWHVQTPFPITSEHVCVCVCVCKHDRR
uniref:Putative secreted protein n=1 Tax=Anopheles marajoara TaxID=58244 RepID=A0A2M4CAV6_9DIPT